MANDVEYATWYVNLLIRVAACFIFAGVWWLITTFF